MLNCEMSRITMKVSGKIAYSDLIQQTAESFLRVCGLSKRDSESLGLAIREAYINAVKHGCRMDPSKMVKVCFSYKKDRLEAVVTDCGRGFNPKTIIDPTTHENRLRIEGRGIFIMRSLSDKVEFRRLKNERGMVVKLIKKIPLEKKQSR
ncbi:MAG: ATP-binding protein [Acidobacteriota bacterium]